MFTLPEFSFILKGKGIAKRDVFSTRGRSCSLKTHTLVSPQKGRGSEGEKKKKDASRWGRRGTSSWPFSCPQGDRCWDGKGSTKPPLKKGRYFLKKGKGRNRDLCEQSTAGRRGVLGPKGALKFKRSTEDGDGRKTLPEGRRLLGTFPIGREKEHFVPGNSQGLTAQKSHHSFLWGTPT